MSGDFVAHRFTGLRRAKGTVRGQQQVPHIGIDELRDARDEQRSRARGLHVDAINGDGVRRGGNAG